MSKHPNLLFLCYSYEVLLHSLLKYYRSTKLCPSGEQYRDAQCNLKLALLPVHPMLKLNCEWQDLHKAETQLYGSTSAYLEQSHSKWACCPGCCFLPSSVQGFELFPNRQCPAQHFEANKTTLNSFKGSKWEADPWAQWMSAIGSLHD